MSPAREAQRFGKWSGKSRNRSSCACATLTIIVSARVGAMNAMKTAPALRTARKSGTAIAGPAGPSTPPLRSRVEVKCILLGVTYYNIYVYATK